MTELTADRSCIDRLRAGDARALEELYDRHSPLMYSVVRRIVGSAPEAEEVLQEAWVQAWRRAGTYDPARGPVVAWLLTLARSRAIDRVRSARSRRRVEAAAGAESAPSPPPEAPAASAMRRQLQERVTRALATLQPQQRQVLELAYFEGLSQSEIAGRIAAPLGTVKSWTRQGLSRLRELMPHEGWT